jgi:hypothetical protein
MRQTFCNTVEDCQWLASTHLRGREIPGFGSFTLHGNEDCPQRIELYAVVEPRYDAPFVAVYELTEDGSYCKVQL